MAIGTFSTVLAQGNEPEAPQEEQLQFDLYSSGTGTFTYADGVLTSDGYGEHKAILQNFSSKTLDVSFTLSPKNQYSPLNGGLYIFASGEGNAQDQIDAYNVNIDMAAEAGYYNAYIYHFLDGTYANFVASTIALVFDGEVEVRVIVDQKYINVYLEGSDIPTMTKKISSAPAKDGLKVGFRSQHVPQTFSDITVSDVPKAPEVPTVKVLMIGNSYAQDTMTYAHEIAKADGVNMVCGVLYYGGCTVKQHVNFIAQNKDVYKYFKNGGTYGEKVTFWDVLHDEDWDYITIQTGQGQQGVKETFYPYLPELISIVENDMPSAEIGLFQSWAVPQCFEGTGNSRLSAYNDNSETMYQQIIKTFTELQAENGVRFVVPSAEGLHRINGTGVCDNSALETSFFRDSTAHVNEKGRYMLGAMIYQTITGRTCIGNTFVPIGYTYGGDRAPDATVRQFIQNVVDNLFTEENPAYFTLNTFKEEVTLTAIFAQGAKTTYTVGEYFDYSNLKVYAVYSDGEKVETPYYNIDLMRPLTQEDTVVTIKYQDKTTAVRITVA